MSNTFTGFITVLNAKEGRYNKSGYSAKLLSKDGKEDPRWFRFGWLESPPVSKGDYVQVKCDEVNSKFATVDSFKVSKNPPPYPNKGNSGKGYSGGGSGYNSDEQRKDRAYHSARGNAIEVVDMLLEHGSLPVSTAKNKAGVSKRFDEISAFVDKFTVKFFKDEFSETPEGFRLFGLVEDFGDVNMAEAGNDLPDQDDDVPFDSDSDADSEDFPEDDGDDDF